MNVIDLIDLLKKDPEFKIMPSLALNKSKLGKFSINEGEYKISNWYLNPNKPNLNVEIALKGTVSLSEGYEKFNIEKDYPSVNFMTLSLIKDGQPNIPLVCKISEDTLNILRNNGIHIDTYDEKMKYYAIDLSDIELYYPIFDQFDEIDLSRAVMDQIKLKSQYKILEDFIIKNSPEKETEPESISEDLKIFLEENDIKKNVYSPKGSYSKSKDPIEFKVKGFSSVPSANQFYKKLDKPASNMEFMVKTYKDFMNVDPEDRYDYIYHMAGDTKKALEEVTEVLRNFKYEAILNNKVDLEPKTLECEYEGKTYTINLVKNEE